MPQQKCRVCALILISLMVSGCASKKRVLPEPEKTMEDVFKEQSNKRPDESMLASRTVLKMPATIEEMDIKPYIRTEANYLENNFKMLPNPTLYMFVAPHLSTKDRVPVPGYITKFQMFERDEYALPGEVAIYN